MADDFPTAVRAAQLVYSNVEAEHSPTNRRGFQVWLCSPGLREHHREIARRLEDFDWPTPDAAVNRVTERFTFFRTAAGDYVIARTVPLTERDALNRAGRFHAHAVVLSPDTFAAIGNDPFRVLDCFPFQSGPGPVIETGAWRHEDPFGPAPIAVGPPKDVEPALAEVAAKLLPLLTRWLDGDDPRPVALPARPERVAAFLRAVFRFLPPALRARATFDTLSTGQSLAALPVRIAGGYDAPTVRDWSYRRAYRLDPESGEFSSAPAPAPNPALDHLAAAWIEDPTLTDRDRDGSYLLAKALLDSAAAIPADPTDRAMALARSVPGAEAGALRLVRDRLAADLPFPAVRALIEPAVREWAGPFGRAALGKLRAGVPPLLLAALARERCDREPLAPPQAAELEAWATDHLAKDPSPAAQQAFGELFLIARRWGRGGARGVRAVLADPQWAGFADGWFPRWFTASSPLAAAVADLAQAGPAVDALFSPAADPQQVDDADILLAAAPGAVAPPWARPLAFVVALHRADQAKMESLLDGTADRAVFLPWVYHHVVRYGWRSEFCLGNADGGLHAGVVLRPASGDPAKGLALLEATTEDAWVRKQLFDWQVHAPPPGLDAVSADDKPVAGAWRVYESGDWDGLQIRLATLTPAQFGWVANAMLADKVLVHKHAFPTADGVWLGLVPVSNGVNSELFAGAYGAVVGCIKADPQRAAMLTHAALYALNRR